ncbi:MAG TPA: alpha/beta fold hydrolase [Acidimicrobiales bacterium]|nr:alpha/beta fold hydrolase [Acidimicrobiales bacterium]
MDLSDKAVELLTTGKFKELHKLLGPQMAGLVTPGQLEDGWTQLQAMSGQFQKVESRGEEKAQGMKFTVHILRFEKGSLKVLSREADGKLAALAMQPGEPPTPVGPPEYADSSAFTESEVRVDCEGFPLPALLTVPKKASGAPAVVMVAGSGPNDRDETIGKLKPFRDIAQGLATKGIASIRYDKRTKAAPGMFDAKRGTLHDEVVKDAVSALKVLKSKTGGKLGRKGAVDAKRIFVLGHSLGALAAPRIVQAAPEFAGMVLLAGTTRPLEDAVIAQMTHLAGPKPTKDVKAQLKRIADQVALVKSPDLTPDTPIEDLPLGINASYWLDLRDFDCVAETAKLAKPVLVCAGEVDYQVPVEQLDDWRKGLKGHPDADIKLYDGLSHAFMPGTGQASDYAIEANVDARVVNDIAAWLLAH